MSHRLWLRPGRLFILIAAAYLVLSLVLAVEGWWTGWDMAVVDDRPWKLVLVPLFLANCGSLIARSFPAERRAKSKVPPHPLDGVP